jgi:LysR family transcriptional regulator, benzoate and cis,cis-muconate-responsive activator of ben and cat genes
MDLKQLRYFSAVCEAKSFVHAAERINMAQPPLSRSIQNLEHEIGVTLIDRTVRPLELTEAGRFLYEQGQRLLQRAEEIKHATRALGKTRRQFFNIGFVGSTLYGFLPSIIRRFKSDFPKVEVGLSEMITLQQQEALLARRIDVGFGRLELGEHPDIERRTILNEPLVLAVPREHRLRNASTVWLEQVAKEPFILYPSKPRPSFADQVLDLFSRHKLKPNVVIEANEIQTALGLVAADIGVTLVPQSVSRLRLGDVVFLSLADSEILSPVIMGFRRDNQTELLAAIINYAEEELRKAIKEQPHAEKISTTRPKKIEEAL